VAPAPSWATSEPRWDRSTGGSLPTPDRSFLAHTARHDGRRAGNSSPPSSRSRAVREARTEKCSGPEGERAFQAWQAKNGAGPGYKCRAPRQGDGVPDFTFLRGFYGRASHLVRTCPPVTVAQREVFFTELSPAEITCASFSRPRSHLRIRRRPRIRTRRAHGGESTADLTSRVTPGEKAWSTYPRIQESVISDSSGRDSPLGLPPRHGRRAAERQGAGSASSRHAEDAPHINNLASSPPRSAPPLGGPANPFVLIIAVPHNFAPQMTSEPFGLNTDLRDRDTRGPGETWASYLRAHALPLPRPGASRISDQRHRGGSTGISPESAGVFGMTSSHHQGYVPYSHAHLRPPATGWTAPIVLRALFRDVCTRRSCPSGPDV